MQKEKKIKVQETLIKKLKSENSDLTSRLRKLEQEADRKDLALSSAETYRAAHLEAVAKLNGAQRNYKKAMQEIEFEKRNYQKKFEDLINRLTI